MFFTSITSFQCSSIQCKEFRVVNFDGFIPASHLLVLCSSFLRSRLRFFCSQVYIHTKHAWGAQHQTLRANAESCFLSDSLSKHMPGASLRVHEGTHSRPNNGDPYHFHGCPENRNACCLTALAYGGVSCSFGGVDLPCKHTVKNCLPKNVLFNLL